MAITALVSAASVVGGLFGSSGPDAGKWAERTADVAALKSLAAQGNVNAWQALGAIGRVTPVSAGGLTIPGVESYRGGWTSKEWGDAYNPIIRDAAAAYNAFAPQFALSGVAASVAQGQTIVQTLGSGGNPVLLPANGGAASGAGPSSTGMMASMGGFLTNAPTWFWLLVALVAFLLMRK